MVLRYYIGALVLLVSSLALTGVSSNSANAIIPSTNGESFFLFLNIQDGGHAASFYARQHLISTMNFNMLSSSLPLCCVVCVMNDNTKKLHADPHIKT